MDPSIFVVWGSSGGLISWPCQDRVKEELEIAHGVPIRYALTVHVSFGLLGEIPPCPFLCE